METPMSTPTPRTDAAIEANSIIGLMEHARTLETELTAALARIAELEGELESHAFSLSPAMVQARNDQLNTQVESLTRQLSESQAQLAEEKRLHATDIKLMSKDRLADAALHREVKAKLEAQLASAREDGERLDWLETNDNYLSIKFLKGGIQVPGIASWQPSIRSAIDSARGVTSPPAVAETGEKDAWQDISTAPKDGTKFLAYVIIDANMEDRAEAKITMAAFDCDRFVQVDAHDNGYLEDEVFYYWMPLPPPPTTKGKEQ